MLYRQAAFDELQARSVRREAEPRLGRGKVLDLDFKSVIDSDWSRQMNRMRHYICLLATVLADSNFPKPADRRNNLGKLSKSKGISLSLQGPAYEQRRHIVESGINPDVFKLRGGGNGDVELSTPGELVIPTAFPTLQVHFFSLVLALYIYSESFLRHGNEEKF